MIARGTVNEPIIRLPYFTLGFYHVSSANIEESEWRMPILIAPLRHMSASLEDESSLLS